jgi:hypothetical protein
LPFYFAGTTASHLIKDIKHKTGKVVFGIIAFHRPSATKIMGKKPVDSFPNTEKSNFGNQ